MPHSIGHSSTRTHPNRPRTWAGSTGQTRKSTGRARCTHCDSTSTRKQHAHIGRYCSAMRSKLNESRTPSHAAPHARIRTAQEHGQTPKGWRERASEARAATAGRAPPGEEERIRPANARGGAETALTRTEHAIRRAWGSRGYAGRAQACSNRNEGHTFTRDVRTLAHRVQGPAQ